MANFCSNCGKGVTQEDKFCSECGNSLVLETLASEISGP
ncbi:MAG: zinc-ribbon domain-containing protein [Halobacteriota archaeon]